MSGWTTVDKLDMSGWTTIDMFRCGCVDCRNEKDNSPSGMGYQLAFPEASAEFKLESLKRHTDVNTSFSAWVSPTYLPILEYSAQVVV